MSEDEAIRHTFYTVGELADVIWNVLDNFNVPVSLRFDDQGRARFEGWGLEATLSATPYPEGMLLYHADLGGEECDECCADILVRKVVGAFTARAEDRWTQTALSDKLRAAKVRAALAPTSGASTTSGGEAKHPLVEEETAVRP